MANDFDQFPLYDPLINAGRPNYMSEIWADAFSSFFENLVDYLTQGGILIPKLTTAQRDQLKNIDDGQTIYNTTLNKFQGREAGAWKTFTTS